MPKKQVNFTKKIYCNIPSENVKVCIIASGNAVCKHLNVIHVTKNVNITYLNYYIDNCTTINKSGYYVLTKNIIVTNTTQEVCIKIEASNVTFDCKYHSINTIKRGIKIDNSSATVNNVVIKNCIINAYDVGIEIPEEVFPITAKNISVIDSLINNSIIGLEIYNTQNISIVNATTKNCIFGIGLWDTNYLKVKRSKILDFKYCGIYLDNSNGIVYNSIIKGAEGAVRNAIIYNAVASWNNSNIGNYWGGFSDNCSDFNNDGICDMAYDVENNQLCVPDINCTSQNIDYYPLSKLPS